MSFIKRLAFAGVAAAAAATLAVGVGGNAYAAPIYADSSVAVDHQHVDAITSITAHATWFVAPSPSTVTVSSDLGNAITLVPVLNPARPMTVQFSAAGGGPAKVWSVVSTNNLPPNVSVGITTGGLFTVTPPNGAVVATNNQEISVTVKVTDGAATAFETLTAQPVIVTGVINAINVTAVTDTVTLGGFNNNVTGQVDFSSTPPGAALALSNNPPGTALIGNHLVGTNAIPSTEDYTGVSVTATDAMGATAVDTFKLDVFGGIVANDTPRLSQGHATCGLNHSRMNVFFVLSGSPTWVHFTIVGPGAINGHQGWVNAHIGLNVGVYGGLLAGHTYTVYYEPVTGQGSTTPVLGSRTGHVVFVSGRNC